MPELAKAINSMKYFTDLLICNCYKFHSRFIGIFPSIAIFFFFFKIQIKADEKVHDSEINDCDIEML